MKAEYEGSAARSSEHHEELHRTTSTEQTFSADVAVTDDAIPRPRSVKINVTGAFITDEGTVTPLLVDETRGAVHDSRDIRLPHHTAVVSHVAIDVRPTLPSTTS